MNDQEAPTYTTRQAAEILGINYSRFRQLVAAGLVPAPPTAPRESGGGFGRVWTLADMDTARAALEERRQRGARPAATIWERREGTVQRTMDRLALVAREMAADPEVPQRWRDQLTELVNDLTFPRPAN